jgi:transcriptional regulator with XRE-family HTH domain
MFRGRGVTEVPANRSPTVRRRELGALLRALRQEHGWTAEEVAERLLVSPSKISRQETGQRGVSQRDIRDLCDLYGVEGEPRQRLIDLASEGKQRAPWQPTGLPYSTYVGLEAEAVSISDYGLCVMPGLLQTPQYARAVVEAMVPRWVPDIVEERVQGRLSRQERILAGPGAPRFEAVVDESVLHRVVGSPAIMRAQLEHLLALSEQPTITVRVIPYSAGALPAPNNKFIILRFASPNVPDTVFVEELTRDDYRDDPAEVEVYSTTFRALMDLAAGPAETRQIIAGILAQAQA